MLTIRPATMADAQRLFEWRNDPVTRANSRNTEPVAWEDHCIWLGRAIDDPARRLLVIEVDGTPAATVRFDYGDETEFSITIAPEWRCKGLSLRIARLALAQEPRCEGYIKRTNVACQRLMRAAGMFLVEDGELQHWRYTHVPGVPEAVHRRMMPVASSRAVSPATKVPPLAAPVSVTATAVA